MKLNREFFGYRLRQRRFCGSRREFLDALAPRRDCSRDSHSAEIAKEEDVKDSHVEQKDIAYQDCEHHMWKFYSCDWATSCLPEAHLLSDYQK